MYRLDTLAEIEDLELTEASADGVLAVEWGTAIEKWMPADHLVIRIRLGEDETRQIELIPFGNWKTRPLGEVTA